MRSRWSVQPEILVLAVILVAGTAQWLVAQAFNPIPPPGTRVRVFLESPLSAYRGGLAPPPERFAGTLVVVDTDSVVVRQPTGAELRLPIGRVQRMDFSNPGPCARHRTRCAMIGTTAGVGLGMLLARLGRNDESYEACAFFPNDGACNPARERRRKAIFVGAGTLLGLGVGLSAWRERWATVWVWPPPR